MAKMCMIYSILVITIITISSAQPIQEDQEAEPCPPCMVTLNLNYVCGTDGHTYSNISELKCQNSCKKSNIEMKHAGPCRKDQPRLCPCALLHHLREICGTDGETYSNESELRCHNQCSFLDIGVKHEGPCKKAE
ncbi:thrombin inhibitor rhodniin-like [Trichogramma pretiosum]|uniref:thrombin inhibitor rhodniin-like n=1 Tax=Trichogramma pretiosum TaxID=7493 RepID=UPI0006C95F7C|nr:thrombin inhibitor rhodniin-like [Trichogramma pretiosum]